VFDETKVVCLISQVGFDELRCRFGGVKRKKIRFLFPMEVAP